MTSRAIRIRLPLSPWLELSGHGVPRSVKSWPPASRPVVSPATAALPSRTASRCASPVPRRDVSWTRTTTRSAATATRSWRAARADTWPDRRIGLSSMVAHQRARPVATATPTTPSRRRVPVRLARAAVTGHHPGALDGWARPSISLIASPHRLRRGPFTPDGLASNVAATPETAWASASQPSAVGLPSGHRRRRPRLWQHLPGWFDGRMDPVVRVSGGLVRGMNGDGVNAFLGIPYARPAVGVDRYRAPQPVTPWDGERAATEHGPTAAQSAYPTPMDTVLPSSVAPGDDYLNVSVWAPEDATALPVMVWIHGGAFVRGANSVPTYDGAAFARDGVVVVGVNYRLGVPGFAVLEGAPTNLGLRDQVAALEWVRENIAAFGGNPDDVTVVGESAGGMSVATLMSSPAPRGLFHKAIIQSGGGTAVCTLDDARRVSAAIAAHLGVPATAEAFGALDPDVVVAAQSAVALSIQADPDPQRWGPSVLRGGLGIMSLFPVIDGDVVPGVPVERIAQGAAAGIPLLIGTTRDEFRLFLVPTGVAAGLTAEVLPLLAERYGWPEQALETYARNRPTASAGDVACAILTDAAFRAPTARLAAAHH